MSLSRRQQAILNQIERALQAADPGLRTRFAAFGRWAEGQAVPAATAASRRPGWRVAVICAVVIAALSVLVVGIRSTSDDCPGLRSDQVIASATVRYAGCSTSTDAWSRGGR
jgi:Protein of unknown function (DUF3040)